MRRALSAALTAFLAAGLLLASPPATADPTAKPAADQPVSTFTPRAPVRVLDTRTGAGPVGAGRMISLDLTAHVPATATAVVLTVTGVTPTAATHVTVFPTGTSVPTASSLNLAAGDTRANQVTVALGTDRRINYNQNGNVHLIADIAGHYATGAGGKFTALPAGRLLDTRSAGGPVGPGATRVVDLADRVPASATAVTFNLTATNPTAATFVTAWPTGTTRPTASNLNITAGDTRPNLVTVAIGADRKVSLYNNAGAVDLIVDVTGFYTPDYGASFVPLAPTRVLDTRNGTGTDGATTPVGPAEAIEVEIDDLPVTATGVIVNITGVGATAATYVTAWAAFRPQPNASTLNLAPGQIAANAATVAFGQLPSIQLYNDAGSVHLVADLAGVFAVLDEPTCTVDCVYAWGRNSDQALGTAQTTSYSYYPAPVVTLSGVRAVDGGSWQNGYAVRHDGSVWAWGNNESGQLGNGWASPEGYAGGYAVPVPVLGLTGATAVAGSNYGAYALRADGTVWAWGSGVAGRLGTGSTPHHTSVPVQVPGLTGVVAIDSGWGTGYALRGDGTVWAWGFNGSGALGNGSPADFSAVPVQVSGLTGITAIAGRDNGGYALAGDGTVWAWGDNGAGQLGNGQVCDPAPSVSCMSSVPVRVSGLTGVTGIAGGINNGYAVRNDGTAWSWGSNYEGALGNGVRCDPTAETCESRVPVQVSNLSDVTQVAGFDFGGYALRADGSVWGWGSNQWGAVGDNAPRTAVVPWAIPGVTGVSAIGSGWDTGYAIVPDPEG